MILPGWLWIPATIAAAAAQTARNALQRRLVAELGGVGATLVRFLYGLPASFCLLLAAVSLAPAPIEPFAPALLLWLPLGALAQILATFLLLDLMERRNFAVGVAWSKTEILLIALAGWLLLGDALGPLGWTAVVVASLGVLLLSAKGLALSRLFGAEARAVAWRGLASGAGFAAAAVAYRASILAAGGPGSFLAVTWALLAAQALQSLVLLAWLGSRDRPVVLAVLRAWRTSLWAGTMGALASAGWFTAFSLAPAASVRTLGLVEMVMALLVSRRLFRERPSGQELVGQALVALAVLLILQAGAG
jgi:drug/metabolite transporter (DMT)-like permease